MTADVRSALRASLLAAADDPLLRADRPTQPIVPASLAFGDVRSWTLQASDRGLEAVHDVAWLPNGRLLVALGEAGVVLRDRRMLELTIPGLDWRLMALDEAGVPIVAGLHLDAEGNKAVGAAVSVRRRRRPRGAGRGTRRRGDLRASVGPRRLPGAPRSNGRRLRGPGVDPPRPGPARAVRSARHDPTRGPAGARRAGAGGRRGRVLVLDLRTGALVHDLRTC